ncbi:DUF2156 domain-containing protein [Maridesulfovibrio sp.]|uniref:DUF2156 domain-containing protein n=1 Tax=Maridesulfovibrio sp. TaxID=2795000 RepID=UPI002A189977|nr:DUF2156 domain-containing protein [Maridesulfovibrio sp.]
MNLYKSAQFRFLRSDDPGCVQTLLPYLKMYGNRCMSYSTTQPGLKHALYESIGYISWLEVRNFLQGRSAVVLSDPVADSTHQLFLIKKLEERLGQITLVQISKTLAEKLFNERYSVYQIGVETELDIQTYSLSGKAKSSLRQWNNKGQKSGLIVEEKELSEVNRKEINRLCQDWLSNRGGKEFSFLTRPLPESNEEGVRFFWSRINGKLQALAGFDPIYSGGKTVGYYHNFDRLCSGAVNGTSAFTLLQAMEKFRLEGKEFISLGLSPLAGMEQGYNLYGPLQKLARIFYEFGEKVYPFKGNDRHKSKFCGRRQKVYVASNAGWFRTMIAATTACGLELQ